MAMDGMQSGGPGGPPPATPEPAGLANRAAALSFAAAFAVIVALVTFSVLDEGSPGMARLAAGIPAIAAVLLLAWATHARMRWSARGRPLRSGAAPHEPQDGSPSGATSPAPGPDGRRLSATSRAKRSTDALPRPVKPGSPHPTSDTSGSHPR